MHFKYHSGTATRFLKILNGLPLWDKDCNALDLGCGAGRHTIALSKRCRSATGTDISPKMIDFANQKRKRTPQRTVPFSPQIGMN